MAGTSQRGRLTHSRSGRAFSSPRLRARPLGTTFAPNRLLGGGPSDTKGSDTRSSRPPGARRRLNPDIVEDPLSQQHAVGDAVEGHAAGHAEVAFAGELAGLAGELEDDLLGDLLDRLREVHLPLRDGRLRLARRTAEETG